MQQSECMLTWSVCMLCDNTLCWIHFVILQLTLMYWYLITYSVCSTNCPVASLCRFIWCDDVTRLADDELCRTYVITASINSAWTSGHRFKGLQKWIQSSDSCFGTSSRCHGASSDDWRHSWTDSESPVPHSEEVRQCAVCIAYFYPYFWWSVQWELIESSRDLAVCVENMSFEASLSCE